jgi:nucleotide-binding universal stress UspA family protein
MFSKILIPTDGSVIANAAARKGVEFAKQVGAEVIALFVAPNYQYPVYVEIVPPSYPNEEEYKASIKRTGDTFIKAIADMATANNVKFSSLSIFSDATAQSIVHAAQEHGCDMIFMGSHGRSGLGQLLLGSVTAKVLSACHIPVLVYRLQKEPGDKAA